MVFKVKAALAHHLFKVIVVLGFLSATLAVVLTFLLHPLAFSLFVLNAPVAAAFQILSLPVVVLALVSKIPFSTEAFLFYFLLTLDSHNLSDLLTRYLFLSQLVLQFFHLVLFDETVLAQVFQCLMFFLLSLGLTDTFLAL